MTKYRRFYPSIHPSPVRPMCRYTIPCMLPSGHKFHTSSGHCWNFNRPKIESNLSVFSLVNSAVNMTLPAFAAERRAAALLLPGARRCRSISFAHMALSSKPAACRCCVWLMGQTDWRTDTGPFYRPCSAYYAHSVKKRVQLSNRRCSASLNFLRRYWVHQILIDGPYSNFTQSFHVSQCRLSDATIWLTEYGKFVLPSGFPPGGGRKGLKYRSPIKYGRFGNPTLNITVTNVLKLIEQK